MIPAIYNHLYLSLFPASSSTHLLNAYKLLGTFSPSGLSPKRVPPSKST
jgi:hypothetical protein